MRGKLRDKRSANKNGLTNHEENALRRTQKKLPRNVQWIDLEIEEEEYDDEFDDLMTDEEELEKEENEIVALPPQKKRNIESTL